MASLAVHLAIAKRYIEKNPGKIRNIRQFYDGNVLPDMSKDKEVTHYGTRGEKKDMAKRHREKVGIEKFLAANPLEGDLVLGKYLHLITDWEFYNSLMSQDYLKSVDMPTLCRDNLYTFYQIDPHVVSKYKISYDLTSMAVELAALADEWRDEDIKTYGPNGPVGELLFTTQRMYDFIERMSDTKLTQHT